MRLPDTNVLLYAVNRHSPQNAVARDWLDRSAREPQGMAMVWVTLVGFIRLATPRPGTSAGRWMVTAGAVARGAGVQRIAKLRLSSQTYMVPSLAEAKSETTSEATA